MLALVKDGAPVASAQAGDEVALLLNQTPFYAESGGQVGDSGRLTGEDGLAVSISDTRKVLGDLHVLTGTVEHGTLAGRRQLSPAYRCAAPRRHPRQPFGDAFAA